MKIWIYPGTFDPFTNGHLDIVRRAVRQCDKLYISVMQNQNKKPFFDIDERLKLIRDCVSDMPSVEVTGVKTLLVSFMKEVKANAVVRGLRSESDFRFEAEMAAANSLLYDQYEVLLLPCRIDLAFTSSSIVKEVGCYGGDISHMVPKEIAKYVTNRLRKPKNTL